MEPFTAVPVRKRTWRHFVLLPIVAWFGIGGLLMLVVSVNKFTHAENGSHHLFLGIFSIATGVLGVWAFLHSMFRPLYLSLGLLLIQALITAGTDLIDSKPLSTVDLVVGIIGLALVLFVFITRNKLPVDYNAGV